MDFNTARERWAAMSLAERQALIEKVKGEVALAGHDWAGLPPQAHAAIIAVLKPEEPSETGGHKTKK